jgi:hypothetical protein
VDGIPGWALKALALGQVGNQENTAMARLPKYTLEYDEKKDKWPLKNDATDKVVKSFESKADATKGGALKKAVGADGGSVKIQKQNGNTEAER